MKGKKINLIVKELKETGEDYEFYPTTTTMLDCIKKDMAENFNKYEDGKHILSRVNVLDCGSGDGRALTSLANGGKKYAIEKSKRLIQKMPSDIFVIGTEFLQSTLIDKEVEVIFCNPPYSEYETWATKIIMEANCQFIYLILPQRWQKVKEIQHALDLRNVTAKVIGSFDFLDAERQARAKVDIIKIRIQKKHCRKNDPFDIWFSENFKLKADTVNSEHEEAGQQSETLKEKLSGQLTTGRGVVPVLVELYNQEMEHLQKMFLSVCTLDTDILKELDVSSESLKEALKQRIEGLKNKYWKELFDNYKSITDKLTHKSRKAMLETLTSHTSIDFTSSNIYAVTIWVIKNANKYYDSQLITLVEDMISAANTKLYKSNERVYTDQDWRYCWDGVKPSHYGLELRIILHNKGGVDINSIYSRYGFTNALSDTAHDFLDDISTIANNLGFILPAWENSKQKGDWESNTKQDFWQNREQNKILMTVKAFKNGNLHIKFNQNFIKKLNVEFGRLKGWLHNHVQASEELNIPEAQTKRLFKGNYQLTQSNGLLQ